MIAIPAKAKICGITRLEDAERAVSAGAWALGFIFFEKSPRHIAPDAAAKLVASLRADGLAPEKLVGVFVDAPVEKINAIRAQVGLTTVQLHGDESVAMCRAVGGEIIKAFRPMSAADITLMVDYDGAVDYWLVDAAVRGAHGGTGQLADWQLAQQFARRDRLILSGGLRPDNVAAAIAAVAPMAVDLASGVEDAPGIKSAHKLEQFFSALKGATSCQ